MESQVARPSHVKPELRPYTPPVLVRYGAVSELTQSGASAAAEASGTCSVPNQMAHKNC
jgi:hypothetical protein